MSILQMQGLSIYSLRFLEFIYNFKVNKYLNLNRIIYNSNQGLNSCIVYHGVKLFQSLKLWKGSPGN